VAETEWQAKASEREIMVYVCMYVCVVCMYMCMYVGMYVCMSIISWNHNTHRKDYNSIMHV